MRLLASIVVACGLAGLLATSCGGAPVSTVASLRDACMGGQMRACDELVDADPAAAPLRTAMSTVVALGNACEAGYSVACTELGRRLRGGLADQPPQNDRAASQFAKACLAGEPSGCAELGLSFYNGTGVAEDVDYGLELIEGSCRNDAPVGCYYAGLVELQGGTDARRATALLTRGCELGHATACVDAGQRTEAGRGVERNLWRATNLYARACDAGAGDGCLAMARMFELGRGVQRNRVFAARMYAEACASGSPDGCVGQAVLQAPDDPDTSSLLLAELCATGHGGACEARAAFHAPGGRLAEDREQHRRWLDRSCELGHAPGCARLALAVVEDQPAQALSLLEDTCDESDGDGLACAMLGHVLAEGLGGVAVDVTRADALYAQSCDAGVDEGCVGLAHLRVERAPQQALEALEQACDMARAEACAELARLLTDLGYEASERVVVDERACTLGSAGSCRRAALTWLWGDGVAFDLERGVDRLWEGCLGDDRDACRLLDELEAGHGIAHGVRVVGFGDPDRLSVARRDPSPGSHALILALDASLETRAGNTHADAVARFVVTVDEAGRASLELVDLRVTGDATTASELARFVSPASRIVAGEDDTLSITDALGEVVALAPVPLMPLRWPEQPLGAGAIVEQLHLASRTSGATVTLEGRRERWSIEHIDTSRVAVRLEVTGQQVHEAPRPEHARRGSLTATFDLELDPHHPWLLAGHGTLAIDQRYDDGRTPALEIDVEIIHQPLNVDSELAAVE